jgi:dUTP pyrophosphatase
MGSRGFEVVKGFELTGDVKIPQRATDKSAGYDFSSIADITVNPGNVEMIPTGIKAYMPRRQFLGLYIRSGLVQLI